jgi:hypothetical protein
MTLGGLQGSDVLRPPDRSNGGRGLPSLQSLNAFFNHAVGTRCARALKETQILLRIWAQLLVLQLKVNCYWVRTLSLRTFVIPLQLSCT